MSLQAAAILGPNTCAVVRVQRKSNDGDLAVACFGQGAGRLVDFDLVVFRQAGANDVKCLRVLCMAPKSQVKVAGQYLWYVEAER